MAEFFKRKKLCYWLVLAATILAAVELAVYLVTGRTQFDPEYSQEAIVGMALSVAIGVFSLIRTYRTAIFAMFITLFFSLITFITSQIQLIANILYNVDGSTFPVTFWITALCAVFGCIIALIAGIASSRNGGMLDALYTAKEVKNDE